MNSTLTTRRNCKDCTPLSWAMRAVFPCKKKKVQKSEPKVKCARQPAGFPNPPPFPSLSPPPPFPTLRFSFTQYLVLNDVHSDGCRSETCKQHMASSFDFQLLRVTTEAIQTGKMNGKNFYVFYQSFVIKLVVKY